MPKAVNNQHTKVLSFSAETKQDTKEEAAKELGFDKMQVSKVTALLPLIGFWGYPKSGIFQIY